MVKSILILSHEYPPYAFGGVATFTEEIAHYLAQQNYNVYVVTGRSIKRTTIEKSNNLIIIRTAFPDLPIRSVWYSFLSKTLILNLLEKADLVIANAGSASFLAPYIKKNKKFIAIYHGTIESMLSFYRYISVKNLLKYLDPMQFIFYNMLPFYKYLYKLDAQNADLHIAVARHVIDELQNQYPELGKTIKDNSVIIYNGIDVDRFFKLSKHDLKYYRFIFAYVGRLYFTKGITYALESFKLIQRELGDSAEMWIFGDGPLKYWIEKFSRKNSLKTKLFGYVSREFLINLMSKYVSVLIFPSLYEGCPYALLEANALGIPVVAWDLNWSKEFIENGINGYRAFFGDIQMLAERAIDSIEISRKIPIHLIKKYDKKNTFQKYIEIINRLSLK
ncbi:Glycosyltransferase [Pyrobaculum oguniense TE7]|uniref:Glycosyltransferase n=1 Tax=Pyrobaculum oguniense (strain DSM 13380 / JCM 10595 / TE7) TaxID=698757 RepID=H6QB87_PYROT|nr:Glycosyltransferase [Pyrobaculum oguniense TE7]